MRKPSPVILPVLILACAMGKVALSRGGASSGQEDVVTMLPRSLAGVVGRSLELGPSERALTRSPHVTLVRRAYGPTRVSLVTTTAVRELHPPTVCLKASGLEVFRRSQEQTVAGCLVHLWVRDPRDGSTSHLYHTYPNGAGQGTCDYWRRTGVAALSRLVGRWSRWASLQVMDRSAKRAKTAIVGLMDMFAMPTAAAAASTGRQR